MDKTKYILILLILSIISYFLFKKNSLEKLHYQAMTKNKIKNEKPLKRPIKDPSKNNLQIALSKNHKKRDQEQIKANHVTEINQTIWTKEYFNKYVEKAYKDMPKLNLLKNLKDSDVHHTPLFIRDFGHKLGKIKKQIKLNETFIPKAMDFYQKCSKEKESFNSIRSLCLANLITLKRDRGEEFSTDLYPKSTVDMAKKVLELENL